MKKPKSKTQEGKPTISQLRHIENEVVFRKANEKVEKGLEKLEKMAKEDGYGSLIPRKDLPLSFLCECSDENCRERIELPLDKYKALHKDRSQFIIMPNHETSSIEEVVKEKENYSIVQKFLTPDESALHLNKTSINNV